MIDHENDVPRRQVLVRLTALAVASLIGREAAFASVPEYPELTTRAIPVKKPTEVLLVAITLTPGGRLVASGEHGVIIYSDNDGASWTQAQVPVDLTLTCVRFATTKIGWAAGHAGVILKTEDGGENWIMQLDGVAANRITIEAAQAPSVQNSPSPGAPLALVRARHFATGGPSIPFLSMIVFSPRKMLALGAYRLAMMTTDGGKSWQDWSLNIYYHLSCNIYDAVEANGIYYLVGEMGLVFSSTDGGKIFLPLASPAQVTFLGVLAAQDGSLLAFGVAGSVYRSQDSGKSWDVVQIGTQEDLPAGRVLSSGSIVLVCESGQIFESTDNGASFTNVPNIAPQPFFDVEAAPNGSLIAVGAAGVTDISKSQLAS